MAFPVTKTMTVFICMRVFYGVACVRADLGLRVGAWVHAHVGACVRACCVCTGLLVIARKRKI